MTPASKRLSFTSTVPASGSPRRTTVAGMNAISHSRTCALTHNPVVRPITIANSLLQRVVESIEHGARATPAEAYAGEGQGLQGGIVAIAERRRCHQDGPNVGTAARRGQRQRAHRHGELLGPTVGHQREQGLRALAAQREEILGAAK